MPHLSPADGTGQVTHPPALQSPLLHSVRPGGAPRRPDEEQANVYKLKSTEDAWVNWTLFIMSATLHLPYQLLLPTLCFQVTSYHTVESDPMLNILMDTELYFTP